MADQKPSTAEDVNATPQTVAEFQKAQAAEWGTYVAVTDIDIPPLSGIRAFNKGDAVPVSHVESGVVDKGLVEKRK